MGAQRDLAGDGAPRQGALEEVGRLPCPGRVWAQMNRLKLFGERIMTREPDRQTAKIKIRTAIMNRFSALGRAQIKAVA
ncbi:hypothetical protein GCM10011415_29620 [Salipiger pallidus]|uniref:Uncharacterized protein n=1 Tax=Salipiger pallidus TaxID=1775170 RepID=A0A8J2ZL97_9RHOB|nr:hypothetical protein GCM10011415_29620 [Salipiger pallidus]